MPLHQLDLLLAAAVMAWGFSFFAGCRNRQLVMKIVAPSFFAKVLPKVAAVDIILSKVDPDNAAKAMDEVIKCTAQIEKDRKAMSAGIRRWFNLQFEFLVMGAIFFLLWHIGGMAARTQHERPPAVVQASK